MKQLIQAIFNVSKKESEQDSLCKQVYKSLDEKTEKLGSYEKEEGLWKNIWIKDPKMIVLNVERNKEGSLKVAAFSDNTIYLYDTDNNNKNKASKMYLEFKEDNSINIIDVKMETSGIGNGSIIMRALIRLALYKNAKKITGRLSPVDNGNKDLRDSFYKKFRFQITDDRVELNRDKFEQSLV